MPFMTMEHTKDPRAVLKEALGDLSTIEIFNNEILVAVYLRPEKTKSGLYMPDTHRAEDKFQSKVGLIIKKGPDAFIDPTNSWFKDANLALDDWIVFKPSDGWSITVNNVMCRLLDDTSVRGRIDHPDRVW